MTVVAGLVMSAVMIVGLLVLMSMVAWLVSTLIDAVRARMHRASGARESRDKSEDEMTKGGSARPASHGRVLGDMCPVGAQSGTAADGRTFQVTFGGGAEGWDDDSVERVAADLVDVAMPPGGPIDRGAATRRALCESMCHVLGHVPDGTEITFKGPEESARAVAIGPPHAGGDSQAHVRRAFLVHSGLDDRHEGSLERAAAELTDAACGGQAWPGPRGRLCGSVRDVLELLPDGATLAVEGPRMTAAARALSAAEWAAGPTCEEEGSPIVGMPTGNGLSG